MLLRSGTTPSIGMCILPNSSDLQCLCHGGCPLEDGALKTAIEAKWGSYDAFIKELSAKTVSFFGSGWSWLVQKADGSLDIVCTANAGNPLRGRCF